MQCVVVVFPDHTHLRFASILPIYVYPGNKYEKLLSLICDLMQDHNLLFV